ncbi:MAG: methyltransferase domain-containing protein [Spirochaetia bacterium]|nr:MAG: methyltransferase domain-containing protein [Spirochaetia bacterium]
MSAPLPEQGNNMPNGYEGLVASLYRQILGREPDQQGWDHYVQRLREGIALEDLIHIFLSSDEHREKQRATARSLLLADGVAIEGEEATLPSTFPADYSPPGEAGRCYQRRRRSGFLDRYCSGSLVLDVGYSGYDNPDRKTGLPGAVGIDLDYPGYDGRVLPFQDETVDTVFSSHCLEHIQFDHQAIRDWFRVIKVGGFIVCMVPSQALYEKQRFLPSRFNEDHKRMYTPATLMRSFEEALKVNTYRVRHLAENDQGFNYQLGPDVHSDGAYEIELVIEKIEAPDWELA